MREAEHEKSAGPPIAAYPIPPSVGPTICDPSQTAVLQMTKGLLTQHAMQVVTAELAGGETGKKFVADSLAELEAKVASHSENKARHY